MLPMYDGLHKSSIENNNLFSNIERNNNWLTIACRISTIKMMMKKKRGAERGILSANVLMTNVQTRAQNIITLVWFLLFKRVIYFLLLSFSLKIYSDTISFLSLARARTLSLSRLSSSKESILFVLVLLVQCQKHSSFLWNHAIWSCYQWVLFFLSLRTLTLSLLMDAIDKCIYSTARKITKISFFNHILTRDELFPCNNAISNLLH